MSDTAFPSAPYAGYTTQQLCDFIIQNKGNDAMLKEIARRESRDLGDTSVMTPGERLRHASRNDAQTVALRLASPLRPMDRTAAPVDGLALFDAHRSPTFF